MKKTLVTSYFALSLLFGACGPSAQLKSDLGPDQVEQMLQTDQFKFVATRAHPLDQSISNIMESMDASGSAFQMLNLNDNYNLKVNGKRIKGELPYFGRRYRASLSRDDKEFKIDFKNALIEKSEKGKRTAYLIHSDGETHTAIEKLYLEVFSNGRANLSISANDRQSISYDGYITDLNEGENELP